MGALRITGTLTIALALAACGGGGGGGGDDDTGDDDDTFIGPEAWEGTWRGAMIDETYDISEDVVVTFAVDSANGGTVTVDVGARGYGPNPPPLTIPIAFDMANERATVSTYSPFFGQLDGTGTPDGRIHADYTTFGFEFALDATVYPDEGRIAAFLFVKAAGLFFFQGKATLCKDGVDLGCVPSAPIELPTPECSAVVDGSAVARMPCSGECVFENGGACITGGNCLQTCIRGECEDRCQANETCLNIDGQFLPDGRQWGACSSDSAGPNLSHQQCGGSHGFCMAGLKCLSFATSKTGTCMPPCETDDDCGPGPGGEPTECTAFELGSNRKYCQIRCTPAGDTGDDAMCPAGMECVPSAAGGNCLWPIAP